MATAFDTGTPASSAPTPPPIIPDRSEQDIRDDISDFDMLDGASLSAYFNVEEPGAEGTIAPPEPISHRTDRLTSSSPPPSDGSPAPVPGSPDDPHRYIPPPGSSSPSPVADAPPAPVSPEAQPSSTLTPAEVEQLLAVRARMETEDFRNAEIIATEFLKDPVKTVTTYFPEVEQAIARRYEVAQAKDSRTFAQKYAEQQLRTKYGEDFTFDPADANYRGTRSYEYRNDEILFLNEGATAYQEARQEETFRAQENQRALMQQAETAFLKAGAPSAAVPEILEKLRGIPNTPENYFAMLAAYAREQGYFSGANPSPPAPVQRASQSTQDELPPASISTIPGSTNVGGGVMAERARELLETFPADFLNEDLL